VQPKWLAPGQGPEVEAVMAAYGAAAGRNARAMHEHAAAVLAFDAGFALELRQQMLAIAMAGAIGEGDGAAARALERKYGASMPRNDSYSMVRRFMVAWSELHTHS
jgi:hypothetical protein